MDRELSGFSKYRQPNGEITYTDKITGEVTKYYTAQCIHCGLFWMVQPGSGRYREFCYKCLGLVCGSRECVVQQYHRSVFKWLEEQEKKTNQVKLENEKKAEEIEKQFGTLPIFR